MISQTYRILTIWHFDPFYFARSFLTSGSALLVFWVVLDKYLIKRDSGVVFFTRLFSSSFNYYDTFMFSVCFDFFDIVVMIITVWVSRVSSFFWHFLLQYNFTYICVNIWMLWHYKSYGLKESIPKWKYCNLSESCSLWLHYYIRNSSIYTWESWFLGWSTKG